MNTIGFLAKAHGNYLSNINSVFFEMTRDNCEQILNLGKNLEQVQKTFENELLPGIIEFKFKLNKSYRLNNFRFFPEAINPKTGGNKKNEAMSGLGTSCIDLAIKNGLIDENHEMIEENGENPILKMLVSNGHFIIKVKDWTETSGFSTITLPLSEIADAVARFDAYVQQHEDIIHLES